MERMKNEKIEEKLKKNRMFLYKRNRVPPF